MMFALSLCISCLASITTLSDAFQSPRALPTRKAFPQGKKSHHLLSNSASDVEEFIATYYPSCSTLLSTTGDLKKISKAELGFTVFVPNETAFDALGEERRNQLDDVRNDEMITKISSYHLVLEPVTADQLFKSGGIVTEGGEVVAERSVSGGFLGIGGKEDGGVTLNGAKVVQSKEFADAKITGIVHELDGFMSPSILWRYADQLRIPGSQ